MTFFFWLLFLVRTLERAKNTGNYAAESCEVSKSDSMGIGNYDSESESSDSESGRANIRHPKKMKVAGLHH